MRLILIVALVCLSGPAQAGPLLPFLQGIATFISTGVVTGAGVGGAFAFGTKFAAFFGTTTLGKLALSVGLSALSSWIERALAPRVPGPSDRMVNFAQALSSMERVYGRVRKGGPLGLSVAAGNRRHYTVIIAAHRTKGLVTPYLDKTSVELDANGIVTSAPFNGVGSLRAYRGLPGQAADAQLVSSVPEVTSAHDYAGLSYLAAWAQKVSSSRFSEVYPNGREWQLAPVWDGHDYIYDPRDETYKWTDNAALIIAHELLFFGKPVDWSQVAQEADASDVLVLNREGQQQKLWTINGVFGDDQSWETVRGQLAAACDARFYEMPNGTTAFRVARWIEPEITLTDEDFTMLELSDSQHGPDVPGEFIMRYVEPARDYVESHSGAIIAGPGARAENECWLVNSHHQAARLSDLLAKKVLAKYRLRGQIKMIGYNLIGKRFARVQIAALGGLSIDVQIERLSVAAGGLSWEFEAISTSADNFVFTALDEPNRPEFELTQDVTTIPPLTGLTATVVPGAGGVAVIELAWPPQDSAFGQALRWRAPELGVTDYQIIPIPSGQTTFVFTAPRDGISYEWQVSNARENSSGEVTEWTPSPALSVLAVANSIAPGALLAFSAVADGSDGLVSFSTPNDPNYAATRIYRALDSTDFAAAVAVQVEYGAPNLADTWRDVGLAPGVYSYWAQPLNASGVAGPTTARAEITII